MCSTFHQGIAPLIQPAPSVPLVFDSSRADDRRNKTYWGGQHDRIRAPTRCHRDACPARRPIGSVPPRPRPKRRRHLRRRQNRRRVRALCRRADRAVGGDGAHLRAALSRHQGRDHRRLQQRAGQEDRPADQGQQARGRYRDLPDPAGFRALEGGGTVAALQAAGLRRHRPKLQGRRGRVLRRDGERHALHVQHRARRRIRCAQLGAGFSQTTVQGPDGHALPGRRRRDPVAVPQDRAEIRLGLHGQVHGQQAELHPGASRPAAQHRVGTELGDVQFDLQHHHGGEEGGQAGGVRISPRSTRRRSGRSPARSSRPRRIPTRRSCSSAG